MMILVGVSECSVMLPTMYEIIEMNDHLVLMVD
jgi:hypothetical protein